MDRVENYSETGRLRCVVLHRPGREHELITPREAKELLFEDIIWVKRLQEEYDQFRLILSSAGVEILEARELLKEALSHVKERRRFIDDVGDLEGLTQEQRAELGEMDIVSLVRLAVEGVGRLDGRVFFRPIPNLMFSRDVGAVIGRAISLSSASFMARKRESIILRYIFNCNPLFQGERKIEIDPTQTNGCPPSLEGGDILVINSGVIVIGQGERTSNAAITALAEVLLREDFTTIFVVHIPCQRSTMHLDTIFTMISGDECLVYPPLIMGHDKDGVRVNRLQLSRRGTIKSKRVPGLLQGLAEAGVVLTPIFCGGNDPITQQREQWNDGANALALAPGKIILYQRNERTVEELSRRGYEVVSADEFIGRASTLMEQQRKLLITLDESELSRGRGGPRCLTMPIKRELTDDDSIPIVIGEGDK